MYVVGYIAFVDFVGCFPFIGDFIRSYLYFKISKMEVDGEVKVPVHPLAQLKAKIGKCKIPPKIARRNTRGPFLFKCCRVIYNKEKNRLELPRGELVGKTIFRGDEDDEDDEEEDSNEDDHEQEGDADGDDEDEDASEDEYEHEGDEDEDDDDEDANEDEHEHDHEGDEDRDEMKRTSALFSQG